MRIRCSACGAVVSSDVPEETVVRAWIECIDCIEKADDSMEIKIKRMIFSWLTKEMK